MVAGDENIVRYSNWYSADRNLKWCTLCQQPIVDISHHMSSGQDAQRHRLLEMLFQPYLKRDGYINGMAHRWWKVQEVYRSAGLLGAPYANYLSCVTESEEARRRVVAYRLHELNLPVFHGGSHWDDTMTCWGGAFWTIREPGYNSLRPAVARVLMGTLPPASAGQFSSFLHLSGHDENLGMLYQYMHIDKLFGHGRRIPAIDRGRAYVIKVAGDNLWTITRGFAPLSRNYSSQQLILAQWCLRALAAEAVIFLMQELVSRLEGAWKELGRPLEDFPKDPVRLSVGPPIRNEIGPTAYKEVFDPEGKYIGTGPLPHDTKKR